MPGKQIEESCSNIQLIERFVKQYKKLEEEVEYAKCWLHRLLIAEIRHSQKYYIQLVSFF